MRLFITGDIHGWHDLGKLAEMKFHLGSELTKRDILLVAGDIGVVWHGGEKDRRLQKWYEDAPWTTCAVDGNHENHHELRNLTIVPIYGGTARIVNDSLYFLERGSIFKFGQLSLFAFSGGISIDKEHRVQGKTWWPEEIPSPQELEYARENLLSYDLSVDIVLTHTAPEITIRQMVDADETNLYYYALKGDDQTVRYLDQIENILDFKSWFFGHFHRDRVLEDGFRAVYRDIIEIRKNGSTVCHTHEWEKHTYRSQIIRFFE